MESVRLRVGLSLSPDESLCDGLGGEHHKVTYNFLGALESPIRIYKDEKLPLKARGPMLNLGVILMHGLELFH